MMLISRMFISVMLKVRGIGVADKVSTSTLVLIFFDLLFRFDAKTLFFVQNQQS